MDIGQMPALTGMEAVSAACTAAATRPAAAAAAAPPAAGARPPCAPPWGGSVLAARLRGRGAAAPAGRPVCTNSTGYNTIRFHETTHDRCSSRDVTRPPLWFAGLHSLGRRWHQFFQASAGLCIQYKQLKVQAHHAMCPGGRPGAACSGAAPPAHHHATAPPGRWPAPAQQTMLETALTSLCLASGMQQHV
jgi:hypothetical protein